MSVTAGGVTLERSRSGWDVVFGILLVVAGVVVLGNAVVATALSVFFFGWLAVISGVVGLVAGLFRIGKGGFWPAVISGALLLVLGIVILRNPLVSVVTLTLLAGTLFLMGGVIRLVAAFQTDQNRWIMVFSGLVSLALGLLVVFNLFEASLQLLGILIGVQAVVDGLTLLVLGRWRVTDNRVQVVETSGSDVSRS
jgi:membrane protein HdeD